MKYEKKILIYHIQIPFSLSVYYLPTIRVHQVMDSESTTRSVSVHKIFVKDSTKIYKNL